MSLNRFLNLIENELCQLSLLWVLKIGLKTVFDNPSLNLHMKNCFVCERFLEKLKICIITKYKKIISHIYSIIYQYFLLKN